MRTKAPGSGEEFAVTRTVSCRGCCAAARGPSWFSEWGWFCCSADDTLGCVEVGKSSRPDDRAMKAAAAITRTRRPTTIHARTLELYVHILRPPRRHIARSGKPRVIAKTSHP